MGIYKKLISAVFHCNAEKAISLMQANNYPKQWLDNIGVFDVPFPLHYISICAQVILSDADDPWSKDFEPIRIKMLADCRRILEFMVNEYGCDIDCEIDYQKYTDYFYAAEKDATDEDILWAPVQRILDEGKSQLDIYLYCAVERFQYDLVAQLLHAGANPRTLIEDGFAIDRIGAECAFLESVPQFGTDSFHLCSRKVTIKHLRLWKREENRGSISLTATLQDSCMQTDAWHLRS